MGLVASTVSCWNNRPLRHLLGKSLLLGKIEEVAA